MAASDVAVAPTSEEEPTALDPRRWVIFGVLCLALLVVRIDGTIVNVALPTLVRELHATSSQLQWIVDAYTIVFAGFLLIAARRRRVAFTTASAPGARHADGRSIF